MGAIRSYRDLKVWQAGMDVAAMCYQVTRAWPREEAFGLTSQARRAATSIPANIAEGYGREGRKEYLQFLRIAQGPLKELETHLLLAVRVDLAASGTVTPLLAQCEELGRMLHTLIRKLEARP